LKLISTSEGDIFQVLSTNGDTHLGGDDIDNLLQAFVHEEILEGRSDRFFRPHGELAAGTAQGTHCLEATVCPKRDRVTLRFSVAKRQGVSSTNSLAARSKH